MQGWMDERMDAQTEHMARWTDMMDIWSEKGHVDEAGVLNSFVMTKLSTMIR